MTIDDLDNVNMVWVAKSTKPARVLNQSDSLETQEAANAIYYQNVNGSGVLSNSPTLVLRSRADFVWASIASGQDAQSYLAWIEVIRSNSGDESEVYYTRFPVPGKVANFAPTLVGTVKSPSRMLRATATGSDDLQLAWVEEPKKATSRIVHSEIDVVKSSATTTNVEDVNGSISQFTLATIRNGELVMGWAYQESPSLN
jgi:hypothetical protein